MVFKRGLFCVLAFFVFLEIVSGNDHDDDHAKKLHKEHEEQLRKMGIHSGGTANKTVLTDAQHEQRREIIELAKKHLMATKNITEAEAERQVRRAENPLPPEEEHREEL